MQETGRCIRIEKTRDLVAEAFKKIYRDTDIRAAICAPFTQLDDLVKSFAGTGIGVGAQNVHFEGEGAFTGEISASMLEEIGGGLLHCRTLGEKTVFR